MTNENGPVGKANARKDVRDPQERRVRLDWGHPDWIGQRIVFPVVQPQRRSEVICV